ncbi:Ribonuclease H-like superfamily protein [Raphanus sativus]|nr:Ribonuclease H-like superfamily protein [Raphanus sativus]
MSVLHWISSIKEALILSNSWITLPPFGFSINIVPWICWFLWISRNKLIFEKKPSTAVEVITTSIVATREWERAQPLKTKRTAIQPTSRQPTIHQPSPPSTLFCNIDAAWRTDTGKAGLA